MNEMQTNPDLDLIMNYLTSIRPGDMSPEASEQLMMIGKRIQAGGSLTDQEREMFQGVMGAMQAGAVSPVGQINEGQTAQQRLEAQAIATQMPDTMTYMIDGEPMEMATDTYNEAVRLGIITPDTVMENIDGMEIARPPMTVDSSIRPRTRPNNLGTMGETRPQLRPDNLGG